MFGALTPSEETKKDIGEADSGNSKNAEVEKEEDTPKEEVPSEDGELDTASQTDKEADKKARNLSQAELEGALFKVEKLTGFLGQNTNYYIY